MTTTKNIVFVAKSLDGFIAGPNGELDWLNAIPNPNQENMGFDALMTEIDALVMGRNTFEMVANFDGDWPYKKHVFVLSNSLSSVPTKLSDKASIVSGELSEILKNLHQQGFNKLYIDGGKTIQSFLKEDLIDELRITTVPILLGNGVPLFETIPTAQNFTHIKTEVFLDQLVQSSYERKK